MRTTTPITALLLGALLAAPAAAQLPAEPGQTEFSGAYPSAGYTQPTFAPTPSAPANAFTTFRVEAQGRALAYLLDAVAKGILSEAQAEILWEEARARRYQNRVVNTETFLHRRRLLDEHREAERHRAWERKEAAAALRAERQRTVLYATYRLPPTVLDQLTGKICWPETLQRPEFCHLADDLNALFSQLASDGAQTDRLYRDSIIDLCDSLRDELEDHRKNLCLEWCDYFECQKLIVGLKYEAEYWRGAQPGAHRLVASR